MCPLPIKGLIVFLAYQIGMRQTHRRYGIRTINALFPGFGLGFSGGCSGRFLSEGYCQWIFVRDSSTKLSGLWIG